MFVCKYTFYLVIYNNIKKYLDKVLQLMYAIFQFIYWSQPTKYSPDQRT